MHIPTPISRLQVILAAELLKSAEELVKYKIHPTSIISGYRLACKSVQHSTIIYNQDNHLPWLLELTCTCTCTVHVGVVLQTFAYSNTHSDMDLWLSTLITLVKNAILHMRSVGLCLSPSPSFFPLFPLPPSSAPSLYMYICAQNGSEVHSGTSYS